MTRRMGLLLGLVAVLATVLFLDRRTPPPATEDISPRPTTAVAAPVDAAQNALNPVARLAPETLAPIFDRPLFRPDRASPIPAKEEGSAQDAEAAPQSAPITPEMPPKLLGTISQPQPGGAFLASGNSGETSFVAIGQSFEGWQLLAVGEDWADLIGSFGPLHLAFPQPQQPAPEATAP